MRLALIASVLGLTVAAPGNSSRQLAEHECSLVKKIDNPWIAGLVRGRTYTTKQQSGCNPEGAQCSKSGLDPVCGSGADSCTEDSKTCAGGNIPVRFNSRSYALTNYAGKCADQTHSHGEYSCADYKQGAMYLAGKTLSFEVDVSQAGCGCNAAIYLVAMPQNSFSTHCHDYYCDANSVCGTSCVEIDLMEANTVAFVSTVHVRDDSEGASFGIAHYVRKPENRLEPLAGSIYDCPYGPDPSCAIDTNKPYNASFAFDSYDFGYTVTLSQGPDRVAKLAQPVRYVAPPTKGGVGSAEMANQYLFRAVERGMTLVFSYWAGETRKEMDWLDHPCSGSEMASWKCTDAWVEHRQWRWTCDKQAGSELMAPKCGRAFWVSNIQISGGLLGGVEPWVFALVICTLLGIGLFIFKDRVMEKLMEKSHRLRANTRDENVDYDGDDGDEEEPEITVMKKKPKKKDKKSASARQKASRLNNVEPDD